MEDREFVRTEVVTNPAVIDAYMKIAGNKQLKYLPNCVRACVLCCGF